MTVGRAAVLGATGPVGIHLTAALRRQGIDTRVVARDGDALERLFGETDSGQHAQGSPVTGRVERMTADLLRTEDVRRAIDGCDTVFQCIGFPAEQMHLHRIAAAELADALRGGAARCVLVSSYWSFMPLVGNPLNEDHPRQGGPEWARDRRTAEDTLREAGAAVVHLPDFYGPHVHTSTLQQPLMEAAAAKTMRWIGSTDTEREYAFVPDAVETIAALAAHDEAYGEHWIVPTAGALNGRRAAEIASDAMAPKIKVQGVPPLVLRTVGRLSAPVKHLLPVLSDYLKPLRYETLKIERLLGPQRVTPYEEGIRRTLDWLRGITTPGR